MSCRVALVHYSSFRFFLIGGSHFQAIKLKRSVGGFTAERTEQLELASKHGFLLAAGFFLDVEASGFPHDIPPQAAEMLGSGGSGVVIAVRDTLSSEH